MNIAGKILSSLGLKRKISSALAVLGGLVSQVPGLDIAVRAVEWVSGAFGLAGLGHSTQAGTLTAYKSGSLAALLSVLVIASTHIPALMPYAEIIRQLATALGGVGVGVAMGRQDSQETPVVND